MGERQWRNRDYLKRLNYPRSTYAFSGVDWGDTTANAERIREKLVINGAPMFVSPLPPGAQGWSNEAWAETYGASVDSFVSIFDGSALQTNIETADSLSAPYNEGTFNAKNSNLYEKANGLQQIQFIASKTTVNEARNSEQSAGEVEEMRSLCIRGPIHVAGWGRTITQRPTDPDPAKPRDNDDEHKMDRSTWKVGPLDIRWDEDRACWRAFNDLIADDESQNLGTWVYSTNPDETCGFPFLRGKLEDVWSVRKTIPGGSLGKTNDTDKPGTVCTKIDSLVFQDGDEFVAPWTDVFIISDVCKSDTPATCGAETTKKAKLSIRVDSDYYANDDQVGPILFTLVKPDEIILGAMYYDSDDPCGPWRPGVEIDICTIGKDEFNIIWSNDQNLASAILSTCKGVSFNQDFILNLIGVDEDTADSDKDFADDSVKTGFEKIETWTDQIRVDIANEIAKSVFNAYQQLALNTQSTIDIMYSDLLAKINECCQTIRLQLAENCSCVIDVPILEGVPPKIPLGALILPDLNRDLGLEPEIAAVDKYITEIDERIVKIDKLDSDFTKDHPSPVTININNPCPANPPGPVNFKNSNCQLFGI